MVAILSIILNLPIYHRILRKHLPHQEFLRQRKRFHFSLRQVHKFRLQVVTHIIVTKKRILLQIKGQPVLLTLDQRLLKHVETDPHSPRYDEVHLEDLLFFIVDHALIRVTTKMSRFQPKGHIMQEFTIPVFLRVEEETEVVKDIVKQIMDHNPLLNTPRQRLNKLIILHMSQPIIRPIILKM